MTGAHSLKQHLKVSGGSPRNPPRILRTRRVFAYCVSQIANARLAPTSPFARIIELRYIIQIGPQPALKFFERHTFPPLIIKHLVTVNFPNAKVFRFWMPKIEPAD